MKKINYKIVLGILLLVALFGSLFLVQQKQDTRKGATSSNNYLRLYLDSVSATKTISLNNTFTVPISSDVTSDGVDAMEATFCYDPVQVRLNNTSNVAANITSLSSGTEIILAREVPLLNGKKCVFVTLTNKSAKIGIQAALINFKAIGSGSGAIEIDRQRSMLVVGPNTAMINSVGNLNYTISGATTCTDGAKQCYNTANYQTCTNGNWGTATNCGAGEHCSGGTCVSTSGSAELIIRVAFAGVKLNDSKCAVDWPIKMKVALSSSFSVSDVVVPKKTSDVNSKGYVIYQIDKYINDVSPGGDNGVSIFLTGPKHISIKYGQNEQSSWFNEYTGKLRVQAVGAGSFNLYDFSEFPLIAGDLTGDIVGTPDGKIDGRDFSYLKEKANDLLPAATAGANVVGDIDGNCQANAGDIRLFKELLKEVNGQTY